MSKTRKTITGLVTAATILGATHAAGADTPRTCVQFDTRFIRTVTTEAETKPVELGAGTWSMEITTIDAYPERPQAVLADQDSERVSVFGVTTDDLPDGTETAQVITTATITLDAPVTEVTATHVHDGHGWQSVMVSTVCFAPVPVEHPAVEIPEVAPPAPPVVEPPAPVAPVVETPAPVVELPVIKAPHFNG